jgi:hypothetical protein
MNAKTNAAPRHAGGNGLAASVVKAGRNVKAALLAVGAWMDECRELADEFEKRTGRRFRAE